MANCTGLLTFRLHAVPFWIVERACEIAESASYHSAARLEGGEKYAPGFGFFAWLFRDLSTSTI